MRWLLIAALLVAGGCALHQHAPLGDGTYILRLHIPQGQSFALSGAGMKAYRSVTPEWELPIVLRNELRLLIDQYALDVVDVWPLHVIDELCLVIRADAALLDRLRADSRIAAVQEVHHFDVMGVGYNDPQLRLQYGAHAAELKALHEWSTGENVRVALIDTPVAVDHEDLRGQIRAQRLYVKGELDEKDLLHGTAVAGIIAANPDNGLGIAGLAPGVTLTSYAACYHRDQWRRTVCDTLALAKALAAAHDDGAEIVNLSLSGPRDALLTKLITALVDSGAIVVAADNPGHPERRFPASMESVIAVTSPDVARVAQPPAVVSKDEHFSTRPGNRYQFFYGTSMSAARVTALTSLVISKRALDYREARLLLTTLHEQCTAQARYRPECSMRFALEWGERGYNASL